MQAIISEMNKACQYNGDMYKCDWRITHLVTNKPRNYCWNYQRYFKLCDSCAHYQDQVLEMITYRDILLLVVTRQEKRIKSLESLVQKLLKNNQQSKQDNLPSEFTGPEVNDVPCTDNDNNYNNTNDTNNDTNDVDDTNNPDPVCTRPCNAGFDICDQCDRVAGKEKQTENIPSSSTSIPAPVPRQAGRIRIIDQEFDQNTRDSMNTHDIPVFHLDNSQDVFYPADSLTAKLLPHPTERAVKFMDEIEMVHLTGNRQTNNTPGIFSRIFGA